MDNYLPLMIDAAIVLIFVIFVIIGRVRGFAYSVLSFASTVLCMVVAKIYASPVAVKLTETFLHNTLKEKITDRLAQGAEQGTATVLEALPGFLAQSARAAGFGSADIINSDILEQTAEKLTTSAEGIIVIPLLTCVIFVLLYIVSKFLSRLTLGLVDIITKLPLIKQIDRSMGAVVGALKGIVFVLLAVLISVTAVKFMPGTPFALACEKAELYRLIAGFINSII